MRTSIFISIVAILGTLIAAVLLGPYIGLGRDYNFFLYKAVGVSRSQAFFWLRLILVIFCVAQLLLLNRTALKNQQHWLAVADCARLVSQHSQKALFVQNDQPPERAEWNRSIIVLLFFSLIFPIFLMRNLTVLSEQNDLQWYQAFINYDIDWQTPVFALGGNLLNFFGIQVPVNGNLAPIMRLAHLLSPHYQIVIAVTLFYAATGAIFWIVGRAIGLRPVPCAVFAGLVALIVNIPYGLEKIQIPIIAAMLVATFWIVGKALALEPLPRLVLIGLLALVFADFLDGMYLVPPGLVTIMFTLTFWWQEAAILSLTGVLLFFFLGQKQKLTANLILALAFALSCFVVLLAYPAGAVFTVPVIALYCLALVLSATSRNELVWKLSVSCALAAAMIGAKFPQFFLNLYDYSRNSYFVDVVTYDRVKSLLGTTMATAIFHVDFRIAVLILVSIATMCFLLARSSGVLKRLAFTVLFVEIGLVLIGAVNAATLNLPLAMAYGEILHMPFLVAFFLAFLITAITGLIIGLHLPRVEKRDAWCASARPTMVTGMVLIVPLLAIGKYAIADASPPAALQYPPPQPPSVHLLRDELELRPGQAFRGRVLVLVAMQAEAGDQFPGGPGSIGDILEFQYRAALGNDHYVHLFPFSIPMVNDFGHWTSPLTFVFLHSFFARKDDVSHNKAFFPLRAYDERIARLIGARMVVTDAPSLPGASLLYETKAGNADLRVFRLENVNRGQYSPTHMIRVSSAAEAIADLSAPSFDPERDVTVDSETYSDLVSASSVSVTAQLGPALSIAAESAGHTLLALPIEYSHCLRLDVQEGASARLIPVNLQQTGLLFERKVKARLAYRFGPFDRPECRRADRERADRLRLREALEK